MKKLLLIVAIIFIPLNAYADGARSTVVMDYDSGRILYEKNQNEQMLIASTTKIMTCLIVLENANLDDEYTVGNEILDVYGTNIYLEEGEKIKVIDLLYGLMLRSGNDAAEVLANNVFDSEDEFINRMNQKALQLKMYHTKFKNPSGLDDNTENYSTAYDMSLLARYAFKNNLYKKIVSTKRYTAKSSLKAFDWYNRMSLLNNYKYCIGGKNGYTPKAGKSLVSYAKKGDMTLIIVTLDDSDIYNNHEYLYKKYFEKYRPCLIIDKDVFDISKSFVNEDVYLKKSFKYPLTDNEYDDISTFVRINSHYDGNNIGKIVISLDNEKIGEVNIYKTDKKKEDNNFFQKFKHLFR